MGQDRQIAKRIMGATLTLTMILSGILAGSGALAGSKKINRAAPQSATVPAASNATLVPGVNLSNDVGLAPQTLNVVNNFGKDSNAAFIKPTTRSYQYRVKGRWGVAVDVNQTANHPAGWNDVDAGAFYKLSPSVRVGGLVGYGQKSLGMAPVAQDPNKAQPRVKIETNLRF